jgi:IclR family acetate operon transcriptional repressor
MQKRLPENGQPAPSYPISSVNNALRLLLLFREQQAVRLTDACRYLGVAHSTAHRLLAMLAYHGFVRQDPRTRAYVAGPALIDVGLAVVQALDLRAQARPALEQIATEFDETAHLAVLEGNQVRYLDAVESTRALRVAQRTGILAPAHTTSVGKALLAEVTVEQLHALYPKPDNLATSTSRSITTREQLEKELTLVRERGYAINNEEWEEGVGSAAIALHDLGRRSAAMAVAAPTSRLTDKRIKTMAEALFRVVDSSPYLEAVRYGG